jgi:DNA polymerase III delta prime subunit
MNDLKGKKIFVGGIQGSGKTEFAKYLIKNKFKLAIGLRLTPDFDDIKNIHLVNPTKDLLNTFEALCSSLVNEGSKFMNGEIKKTTYDVLVIDEADLLFRNSADLGTNARKIMLMHRHFGLSVILITRRPQDIPSTIQESCFLQIYFKLEGKNIKQRLDGIHPDLMNKINELNYHKHNFIIKYLGESPKLHKAIKI